MATKSGKTRGSTRQAAGDLVREVVRDGVVAARETWRLAHRVGSVGLRWFEKAADEIIRELE